MTFSKRFATLLSLSAALGLTIGCGGGESVDKNTVIVPEPLPVPTTGGTPSGSETPVAAATGSTESAKAAPSETPAVKAEGFGTLKGRVTFAGDPPANPILIPKGGIPGKEIKDAQVCAAQAIPNQELVVDPETKGVRYALVYIPRPTAVNPEAESAAKSAVVDFDQKGCVFEPHVLAVMKGATINIKSSDPVGHNVNSRLINTKFNTSIQPNAAPFVVTPKAGETAPGEVVCDIHNWMKAYWYIANNPYFAVTDEKGNFEIKNVPAGTQKVVVWAEAVAPKGYLTPATGEPITIKADGETVQDFTIQANQIRK